MYFISELPNEATELSTQLKQLIAGFFAEIPSTRKLVPCSVDPLSLDLDRNHIFRVVDGTFALRRDGRTISMIEEGDIFGIDRIVTDSPYSLLSEFAVGVELIKTEDLFAHVASSLEAARNWTEILSKYQSLYQLAFQAVARDDSDPIPSVRQFEVNDEIISQGTNTTDIFTMVEGQADVIVNGKKIGTIAGDEIFGALAAFADTPRTATVRATQRSVVLSLPADQFVGLMTSRPATAMKLIRDMARAIVNSNSKLVALF